MKKFKAESQKVLDMMINSIYTNKEIFLRELLSNCSDAIDKLYYKSLTGDISGLVREDFEIKIEVDKEKRTLTISDNGIGISERHLTHIFDKFYRVPTGDKHDVRGYGLGLYYARTIVERHNGQITAQSRKGEGTTITITLPNNEK